MLNPNAKTLRDLEEDKEELELELEEMDPTDALQRHFGPSFPSKDLIQRWKTEFGRVDCYMPEEDEVYLLRPLRRGEWARIIQESRVLAQSAAASQDPTIVDNQLHERVVGQCTLYPNDLTSPTGVALKPAGLYQTLFNLIMEYSHFISQERALASCTRL